MADIEKISVGGTSYDVRDALAAHALSDIAVAGSNIEFLRDIQDNYSVQGSLTINNGVASGFSTSNYIYKDEIWNTIVNAGSFTFQSKFKVTKGSSSNLLIYDSASSSNQFLIGCCDTLGRVAVNINGTSYYSAQNFVVTGVDYWLRFTYDSTTPSILVELSTDGSTFNTAISQSSVGTIGLISSPARIGMRPNNTGFQGSIDLVETSFVDSNGDSLWKLVGLQSDKLIVNATASSITVDQTYNSASANPQSGVAINGAGFLKNSAVGSNSLTILGNTTTSNNNVNIGKSSSARGSLSTSLGYSAVAEANSSTAIGSNSKANGQYSIGIGDHSNTNGASGIHAVAIGHNSSATQNHCVAIGNYAGATGYSSVAIGLCQATANYAIQLGNGTNGDANTFSVGLSSSTNYRLLNSNGTIPGERMALQGTEAPTTATVGSVGQFYVDTTNQIGYMCVSTADSTYVWKQITA